MVRSNFSSVGAAQGLMIVHLLLTLTSYGWNSFSKGITKMIVGVTHDGHTVLRLSVSTKVAIGMPPQGKRNYPSKIDHFVFLRKRKTAKGVE